MSDLKYHSVVWMQEVTDASGKKFYTLGPMADMEDTLAVTPVDGNGSTLFFCQKHNFAYGLHEVCLDCRLQPRELASE